MRLKVKLKDFMVQELLGGKPGMSGAYALYRVTKSGITSLELQERIAAALKASRRDVVIPSLKDKDAIATQHVSVRGRGPNRFEGDGFRAEFVGRTVGALLPQEIAGNRFTVTVRDLSPEEAAHLKDRSVQTTASGFPNYFDEQRFGSHVKGEGLPGKKILLGDAEGALKAFIALPMLGDTPETKKFKAFALEHWGEWGSLFDEAPRSNVRSVLTFLKDHPEALRKALNLVDPHVLSISLSAYQSFLWNRISARFLLDKLKGKAVQVGKVTVLDERLPVYKQIPDVTRQKLIEVQVPLPHHKLVLGDDALGAITGAVLKEEGIEIKDLKARLLLKAYLSGGSRRLVVVPEEMGCRPPEQDEVFQGKLKLDIWFRLPPGSYATMMLKCLAA